MECCCSSQRFFAITLAVGSNCAEVVLLPPILSPKPDTRNKSSPTARPPWLKLFATRVSTSCGESAGKSGRMRIVSLSWRQSLSAKLLILDIAGVDHTGKAEAVGVSVQVCGAAQFVFQCLSA